MSQQLDEEAIFHIARQLEAPDARATYLLQVCAGDQNLRERVEALLDVHEQELEFLKSTPEAAPTVDHTPITETAGQQIGRYKLMEQIGEGGMGLIYAAEQQRPIRRKVAVKIIKPGMDTKEVVARFEAERQALALMDHPNIAKVFDAGATESGRPYFVMELVRGIPFTQYCDRKKLPARQRLELFVTACQGVQHAHQKGIIHRDLKPNNVLITEHDGEPVVKIIDFGVAKAINQQLTERTIYTRFQQMVGTPMYMSPEQAELSGLDVDTRSDVYSLGVLLYEVLTGTTPFDKQRFTEAAYEEIRRIIREEEPPKPSTKISTLGDSASEISDHRQTDPRRLRQLLQRDLDWIVMKALEKDRGRRYETANGFAADIQRYLDDEPVTACPPSAVYRFRKFARRNKAALVVASTAALTLVVLAIGSLITAGRFRSLVVEKQAALTAETESKDAARIAQRDAERARDQEKTLRKQAQQQSERAEANFAMARSAVDKFLNHVTENELLSVPGLQPLRQELLSSSLEFYDKFTRDEANASELLVELATAHHRIAVICGELGQKEESTASNAKAIELLERFRDSGHDSLAVQLGLGRAYYRANRHDDTVAICQEVLGLDPNHADTRNLLAKTYNSLALEQDDIAATLAYHQEALKLRGRLVEEFPHDPAYLGNLGGTVNNLGLILARQGRNREALRMFERAASYCAEAYKNSPQTIRWGRFLCINLQNAAWRQKSFGEQDEALQSYQKVVAIRRKLAFDHPAVPSLKGDLFRAWINLGTHQRDLDRLAESQRSFKAAREVLENIPQNTPAELFDLATVYGALARPVEGLQEENLLEQQRFSDRAMEALRKAVEGGYQDVKTLQIHKSLVELRKRDDFQELVKEVLVNQLAASRNDTDTQKLASHHQAVNLLRDLIGSDAANGRHRSMLAAALQSVGEIQIGLQQYDEAEQSLQKSLELWQMLRAERSEMVPIHRALSNNYFALTVCFLELGRPDEASTMFFQAIDEQVRIVRANPAEKIDFSQVCSTREYLVDTLIISKQRESVEALFRRELLLWENLQSKCEDKSGCHLQLLDLHHRFADWLKGIDQPSAADAHFGEAREILESLANDAPDRFSAFILDASQPSEGKASNEEVRFHHTLADLQLELARRGVLAQKPRAWETWQKVALRCYPRRKWEGVEKEVELAVKLVDGDGEGGGVMMGMAPLLLLAGKRDEYHELCDRLLNVSEKWDVDGRWHVIAMCSLDSQPASDPERLLSLAQRAIVEGPYTQIGIYRMYYRVGDYDKAIEELESFYENAPRNGDSLIAELDLAIAHHLAGHHADALAWFERAIETRKTWNPETRAFTTRMMFEVIRHEAEQLILGDNDQL